MPQTGPRIPRRSVDRNVCHKHRQVVKGANLKKNCSEAGLHQHAAHSGPAGLENMGYTVTTHCAGVDWQAIADTLRQVGMAYHRPEVHRRAFEASHTVVFVYENKKLLGFGRAISDGQYQGAIYDVAVVPEAQGKGIGKIIVQTIMEKLSDCNLILYATPGREGFYRKLGFGSMKTGMAIFTDPRAMAKFTG